MFNASAHLLCAPTAPVPNALKIFGPFPTVCWGSAGSGWGKTHSSLLLVPSCEQTIFFFPFSFFLLPLPSISFSPLFFLFFLLLFFLLSFFLFCFGAKPVYSGGILIWLLRDLHCQGVNSGLLQQSRGSAHLLSGPWTVFPYPFTCWWTWNLSSVFTCYICGAVKSSYMSPGEHKATFLLCVFFLMQEENDWVQQKLGLQVLRSG